MEASPKNREEENSAENPDETHDGFANELHRGSEEHPEVVANIREKLITRSSAVAIIHD